jgi:hypothetical protein
VVHATIAVPWSKAKTDDEARREFERWLRQTGRDRRIVWDTITMDANSERREFIFRFRMT